MRLTWKTIAVLGLSIAAQCAFAANGTSSFNTPARGISMDQVEQRFGEPRRMIPPVGDPPITRWIYADYTVYFEYDLVVHAVVNEKRPKNR